MSWNPGDVVTAAKEIIRDKKKIDPGDLLKLTRDLKSRGEYAYARRILAIAPHTDDPKLDRRLRQEHALCTFRDNNLPKERALDLAAEILGDDLRHGLSLVDDWETLGLAGAIYRRQWELYGRKELLERSYLCYLRGHQLGASGDQGYNGTNAAFIQDMLAFLEQKEAADLGAISTTAAHHREEAKRIREGLVATLDDLLKNDPAQLTYNYWLIQTLAETFLGLGRYDEARHWLQRAFALPDVPDWQLKSTARQFASIAHLQDVAGNRDVATIRQLLGDCLVGAIKESISLDSTKWLYPVAKKVGLALSGGGFRASLFHIGVLAKLAELDLLRHVEVLSCVSGGSIVGAHYYLELRKLLGEKRDESISRDDYIRIVQRLIGQFLGGVQKNIRTRVAAEFWRNLLMIARPRYTHTHRIGELFEEIIYSGIEDGGGLGPLWLDQLSIWTPERPFGMEDELDSYNTERAAKIPVLVINATVLNTGHSWYFTPYWMGEPSGGISHDIDANDHLLPMQYLFAPAGGRRVRLGHAVAASACVPGVFEPITLTGLYSGKTVRLVDGGVYDNQGIAALLERYCNVIIVSDGSGQIAGQDEPAANVFGVAMRSNSILMSRVRQAQYNDLAARLRSGRLHNLMFIHLNKGLSGTAVNWVGNDDPPEVEDWPVDQEGRTRYGFLAAVQRGLATIRTDLDSFSDAEAYALMTSGYRMVEAEHNQSLKAIGATHGCTPEWRFLSIEEAMVSPENAGGLIGILEVARNRTFKVWRLLPWLQAMGVLLSATLLAAFLWACWRWAPHPLVTVGMVGAIVVLFGAIVVISKTFLRMTWLRNLLWRLGIWSMIVMFGWIAARIQIHLLDKFYLRYGKVERVVRARQPGSSSIRAPVAPEDAKLQV
jgi:predicted acylesterase/phospholipase RssA